MELEDYVEKLQKQKKVEKKQRKKQEKDEKIETQNQRKRLMKFTSSQKLKISPVGRMHMWKIFKERRKNYYNYPRGVVYLSSIPHGFFEEQMASYFNQFGKVTGIYMPRAPSGKIRGYAFIEFQLEVIAKIVAETMNNYLFYQRILKAKYIPPEQQKPYMFVYPFGDKRKTALKIEAEIKRRNKTPSAETYKQKIAKKLEKVKRKMATLDTDYTIQISGEAPTPPLPATPSLKKNATKKKLKSMKSNLISKSASNDTEKIESLFDEKLTKQIKKNISRKLAKPLGQKKSKEQEDFVLDDSSSEGDDFETADENSFFEHDFNSTAEGFDSLLDSDEDVESPAKKAKKENPTKATVTSKSSTVKKSEQKSPKITPQTKTKNKTAQGTPAQVKSDKKKTQLEHISPSTVKTASPTGKAKKALSTPQTLAAKTNKPSPLKLQTPKLKPDKVTSPVKSSKKKPVLPVKGSAEKLKKATGTPKKSAGTFVMKSLGGKGQKEIEKVGDLKRKSMSDVKKSKLKSVEKKRKSLPK